MRKTIFAGLLALMMLIFSSLAIANGEKVRKGVVDLNSGEGNVSISELEQWPVAPATVTPTESENRDGGVVSIKAAKQAMKKKSGGVSIADARKYLAEMKKADTVTLEEARIALAKERGIPVVKGEWFRLGKEFSGADTISEIVVKACLRNFTADVLADNALTWEQAKKLPAGFEFFIRREFLKDEFKNVAEAKFRDGDQIASLSKEVAELRAQLLAEDAAMEIAKDQIATLTAERDNLQVALAKEQSENAAIVAAKQVVPEKVVASLKTEIANLLAQNAELKKMSAQRTGGDRIAETVSCHESVVKTEKTFRDWPIVKSLSNFFKSVWNGLGDENLSASVSGKGGRDILLAEIVRNGGNILSLKGGNLQAFLPRARTGPEIGRC